MTRAGFLRPRGAGAELAVKVTPRAARAGIDGPVVDAAGAEWLAVRVTEPPESGRATRAVEELVADCCALPRRSVRLVSGASSRWKRFLIDADAELVRRRLKSEPPNPTGPDAQAH